jgi:hypothetical protein
VTKKKGIFPEIPPLENSVHWNIFFSGISNHLKGGISGKMPKKWNFGPFFIFFLIFTKFSKKNLEIQMFSKKEPTKTIFRKIFKK